MAQILLPDLSPGTTYNVQVRAKNSTGTSDWSPLFSFTTQGDTLAPSPVTSLSWTVVGTAFHGTWTAPTTNSDSSALKDFKDYKVVLTANSISVTQYTTATSFDLTFEQNKNMFGTPQATVQIQVYARDNSGNLSTVSTASATNPAPAQPANLVVTPINEGLVIKWDAVADTDVDHYEVNMSTTSGFTPSGANLVYSGLGTGVTIATAANYSTEFIKVCAVDVFGTKSTYASGSGTPTSSFVVDTTPPAQPTSLSATGAVDPKDPSGANIIATVTWSQTSVSDLAGFTIRYRKTGDTNWYTHDVNDGSLRAATISGLSPGTGYDFQIKSFDFSGNTAGFTATSTMASVTDTTAPSAPSGVTLSAGLTAVIISWTENTEADVKNGAGTYEVQIATNSGFTTGVQTNKTTSTVASFTGLTGGGTYFARVRAIDSSGNASAWTNSTPASTTATSPAGSDGSPPGSSPTPTILSGYGSLFATWTPVVNNDTVTYEVHLSTTTGFTPSGATKVAEVSGTLLEMKYDAAGAALVYGTTYYCKLIAKDHDGSAAAGAQGSGTIAKVSSGDINTVSGTQVHDGSPPASSPTPTLKSGIGYFLAYWTPVTNNDPVTYEVHMSTTTGFTPSASTKVGETTDSSTLVRTADSTGTLLSYGTTYFCKIIAKDLDGSAAASAQASGTINQVSASDIVANTITASQIAANTITAGQIAANTITASQIAANTITASQIAANTITASQIAANTITAAQIAASTITTSQIAAGTITGSNIAAGTITASNLNVSVGGGNIMFNSAFLSSAAITTYWGSLNTSSFAYSSTHAWFGTQAGLATANGTGVSGIYYVPNGVRQTITQVGQVYSASIWVYPSVTTNMRASLEWWTATTGGSNVSTTAGSTISCTANTWTRITVTGTVPATATAVVPTFYSTATPANGTTFYFDAGQLETGDVVTAYGPRPDEVLPGTITATQIAANTITAGQIAASTITATQIAANTITASQIASATITSTQIAAGTITASNINMTNFYATAGTITNTLTIGASGAIQSSNYSAGSTGWQLSQNGLEINGGTIRAAALLLQQGENLMPAQYAGFEFNPAFYTPVFAVAAGFGGTTGTMTVSLDTANKKYESTSMKIVTSAGDKTGYNVFLYTPPASSTDYNIPVDPSTPYIISFWAMAPAAGNSVTPNLHFSVQRNSDGAFQNIPSSTSLPIDGVWRRYSGVYTTDATTSAIRLVAQLSNNAATVYMDGIQVEKQYTASTTPSPWRPPGVTSVDGGIVKTGSIQSTSLVTTGQSSGTQPAWSINVSGSATFANALVRGHLIVGDSSSSGLLTDQYIASANFVAGTTGYVVKGDGTVEFNSGTFRGSLQVGGSTAFHVDTSGNMWSGAASLTGTSAPNPPTLTYASTGGSYSSTTSYESSYMITAVTAVGETAPCARITMTFPGAVVTPTNFSLSATSATSYGITSDWTAGTTYYFVMTAVGLGGESLKTTEHSFTPTANQFPIFFFDLQHQAKSYRIYFGTTSGTYTNYIPIGEGSSLPNLLSNNTYAPDTTNGAWGSNTVRVPHKTGAPAGSPPASNTSANTTTGLVTLTWSAVPGATSYNVWRARNSTTSWTKKNVVGTSTTDDSTNTGWTTYSGNYGYSLPQADTTIPPFSVTSAGVLNVGGNSLFQGLFQTSQAGARIVIGTLGQSALQGQGINTGDIIAMYTGDQWEYTPAVIGTQFFIGQWGTDQYALTFQAPSIVSEAFTGYDPATLKIYGPSRDGTLWPRGYVNVNGDEFKISCPIWMQPTGVGGDMTSASDVGPIQLYSYSGDGINMDGEGIQNKASFGSTTKDLWLQKWGGNTILGHPYAPSGHGLTDVTYQGTDLGTTTRTTYGSTLTGSASGMTLNFTAPPSGRITVVLSSYIRATAGVAYMDCVITDTVTSTVKHAAADGTACQNSSASSAVITSIFVLSGLTAGNAHTAVLNFRSSVGTSTAAFDNFRVTVLPSLGT